MTARPGRGQQLQVFYKFQHQGRRGKAKDVNRRNTKIGKEKHSVSVFLPVSISRKAVDVLLLGSHPRKILTFAVTKPHQLPGHGDEMSPERLCISIKLPLPTTHLPIGALLGPGGRSDCFFSPPLRIPNEGQTVFGAESVQNILIFHSCHKILQSVYDAAGTMDCSPLLLSRSS